MENQIGLNKFSISQGGAGICTAYIYASYNTSTGNEYVYDITPCIFSSENNKPYAKKSKNESPIDVYVGYKYINSVKTTISAGWRNGTFTIDDPLPAGTNIWFGSFSGMFTTRFDYGGECYRIWPDYELYPEVEDGIPPPYIEVSQWDSLDSYKFSWYFTYTAAQNYIRTLTQGVNLADSRKLNSEYKRTSTQTVNGSTALTRLATFPRLCLMTAYNSMTTNCLPTFIRSVVDQVWAMMGVSDSRGLSRICVENTKVDSTVKRSQGFYRKAQEGVRITDSFSFPVLFLRSLSETARITDSKKHWAAYIRGLRIEAASIAETSHGGEYYRFQADTVQAQGTVFRGLLIFIRLITTSFVRDYLLRRFLKSNEELVLKSCVCREITIDSAIH